MKTIKKLACLSLILVLTAGDREPDNSGDAAPAAATTSTVNFADQANAGEEYPFWFICTRTMQIP